MSVSDTIYQVARSGTQINPGLPDALARLVVAQSQHETGNYTSNLFKKYNNAFGYSYSGSKYQLAPGTLSDNGLPIATYASVADSTREIVDYIFRRYNEGKFPALDTITTPEQYARLLKSVGYYGDAESNYLRGLKNYFTTTGGAVTGLSSLFIMGVLAYMYFNKR